MATATFDPRNVSIIIGSHVVGGFADGTFITVERSTPTWSKQIGASGESVRIKSNDRSGKITLTLQQTSLSNDVLDGYRMADELKNAGKFPFIMNEAGGASLAEGTETWVLQPPNLEYGKDLGTRQWVLETGDLFMAIGGMK